MPCRHRHPASVRTVIVVVGDIDERQQPRDGSHALILASLGTPRQAEVPRATGAPGPDSGNSGSIRAHSRSVHPKPATRRVGLERSLGAALAAYR